MAKTNKRLWQVVGAIGVLIWLAVFIKKPGYPTPDKLLYLLIFIAMMFSQGLEVVKRFLPFVMLILVYESFRGLASQLNSHVNYTLAPHIDRLVFGKLPIVYLQNWLWRGRVSWYDYALYLPYLFHFVMPLVLGVIVWKTRPSQYWRVMWTYIVAAFAGFVTFLLFPAAPPWMASQNHYIEPITRISSVVWYHLGLHNFATIYERITPNSVAAIPSLHAAWATLLLVFVYKLYGRRWALLAAVYPALIFVGTVYEGEHYAFDIFAGIAYGLGAYFVTPHLINFVRRYLKKVRTPVIPKTLKYQHNKQHVPQK